MPLTLETRVRVPDAEFCYAFFTRCKMTYGLHIIALLSEASLLKRSPGPYQCWRAALCPSACAHTCACAFHHTDTPHVGHERARASHSAQRASSRAAGSLPRPCQAEGLAADIKMSSCRKASAGPMLPVIYIGPEHIRRGNIGLFMGEQPVMAPRRRQVYHRCTISNIWGLPAPR